MSPLSNISVEKVILMICGPCSLPSERDEAIFTETIGSLLRDTGKGFAVWVKGNQIAMEPEVLLQMILGRPTSSLNTQPQRSCLAGEFTPPTNVSNVLTGRKVETPSGDHMTSRPLLETHDDPLRQEQNSNRLHQTLPKQTPDPPSARKYVPPVGGFVMLKTRLFRGNISYDKSDTEIFLPGFQVPDWIKSDLREKYFNIPEAIVKTTYEKSGQLDCSVNTNSKAIKKEKSLNLEGNETVMLKTCVRHGRISMEEGDLEFIYPQWKIPPNIFDDLKDKYWSIPLVQLCVISDEKGKLRVQEITTIMDRTVGKYNKLTKSKKSTLGEM